jgi:hypothetical protein
VFGWTDDLVAKQINTAFKAKPFNVRKAPTEGFSPNGCIDASYNWDTSTPPKGLSLGLEGRATSAAPVFFEPLLNVPITLEAADGDRVTHDMILRKGFLQVKRTSPGSSRSNIFQRYHSVALHEARSPFEARIMHVKDLAKSQYLQQYWKIPKGFDFESTSGSGSLNGDLQVDGDLKVNGDVRVNGELQANGDLWIVESLSDYLRKTSPPSSAEDTLNLWDSAAEIFKWVDLQIDELSYESLSRRSATYANYFSHYKVPVRHGHITPENIFVYRSKTESPYVGRWKIGDLGISPMKVQEEVLKGMHIFGVFRIYANMLLQMMATAMACRISMEQTATYHSKKYGLQQ